MSEQEDGDDGYREVGGGDDPFSDLERVSDDEESEGDGEDLYDDRNVVPE